MNFSVPHARRKWRSAARGCGKAALLALGFLASGGEGTPAAARTRQSPFAELEDLFAPRARHRPRSTALAVPLPQPRPAKAPPRVAATPAVAATVLPEPRPAQAPVPSQPDPSPAVEPPVPSACRLALTEDIAVAPSIPAITGPGECGGEDLVRLEAVVLRDRTRVPLKPAATLRCEMASAVAAWVRDDLTPLAMTLNSAPAALDNFDSFDCRGRNRASGGKVSEHGHANALDVRGFTLRSGLSIGLTDRATARDLREKVLQSVCARFSTVLGPGSDGYHEDHVHLDLAARRSGYRICQWTIDDALPTIAPMLPVPRPDNAPRLDADEPDAKSERGKPDPK